MGRTTVINCTSPARVPVDRVRFQVDPKQVNFRRAVTLSDASDQRYGTGGDITRVRMNRGGNHGRLGRDGRADRRPEFRPAEDHGGQRGQSTPGDISAWNCCRWSGACISIRRANLHSGFTTATANSIRRSTTTPGSSRLIRPQPRRSLDRARTIEAYSGRPDDRPWSERHKAVLWLAMVLAVIVLAALAIRGLKATAVNPERNVRFSLCEIPADCLKDPYSCNACQCVEILRLLKITKDL